MLKLCARCGAYHRLGAACERGRRRESEANAFRQTHEWELRSQEIRERDGHLCALCSSGYDGEPYYEAHGLSVHHIIPLSECRKLERTAGWCLITLCRRHHRDADAGRVDAALLHGLARERERALPRAWL